MQLEEIGVDPRGAEIMAEKFQYFTIRLFHLNLRQAAILKQEMLAEGAEAAVPGPVFNGETDAAGADQVLLNGTLRQIRKLIAKLRELPLDLAELGDRLERALVNYTAARPPIYVKGQVYDWRRTYIMGIINLTPDSFSQDGLYSRANYIDRALAQAEQMVKDGADFLDVGAESTRPGYRKLDVTEEENRLLPALRELRSTVRVPLSVDTYKPEIAAQALELGADIINDIWGLQAPDDSGHRMAQVIAAAGAPVVVMHNREEPGYDHLMKEMVAWLGHSLEIAAAAGIRADRMLVDPGIGFGKRYEDNLTALRNLSQLKILGKPILLGTSRKSVIGLTLDLPVDQRLEGTIATAVWGMFQGANIIRVHDVREVTRAIRMGEAIRAI